MRKDELESLEETNQEDNGKGKGKKVIIGVVGILSAFLIITMVFGISYLNREKAIKQADGLIAIEKYDDGIALYDNLLSKKYSLSIMNKRNEAVKLMESDENLKMGLEAYEEDDINRAVRYLLKVPKDDMKRYEVALEELTNIEEIILMDISQLMEDGNLDEAREIANNYLKVDSKNVKVQNLKDSIDAKKAEAEKQTQMEKQSQEEEAIAAAKQAEEEAIAAKKNAEARATANSIIGTYRTIIATNANLRDAPSLKSGVVTVLPRGTYVYIHDTQTETADRIWCHVSTEEYGYTEYGWISYNTLNYEIQ